MDTKNNKTKTEGYTFLIKSLNKSSIIFNFTQFHNGNIIYSVLYYNPMVSWTNVLKRKSTGITYELAEAGSSIDLQIKVRANIFSA